MLAPSSLQLREHGLGGVAGDHARHHVEQEHKAGQEVIQMEFPVLAVPVIHKPVRVSQCANHEYLKFQI